MISASNRGEIIDMEQLRKWGRTAAAAALIALSALPAQATSGLRSPLGEVVIRHLKIGQTYSMYKLMNLPLRVVNTGDEDVDLHIETVAVTDLLPGYVPTTTRSEEHTSELQSRPYLVCR